MTHPQPPAVLLHARELSRDDLIGLPYISYLRFSSKPQEKGTSIDRQYQVLERIVSHYELVRDGTLEDRGLSASKNHHRDKGQLGVLLKMISDGEITPARPVVLTIEATDRLFRSGNFDAMDVLRDLIRKGGMILVTGDLSIWNDYTINNSMKNIKLVVEINIAREYAVRLGDMARGAHAGKRKMMEALMDNPDGPKPQLAGRPPAWIVREDGVCTLHPIHAETVRLIFRLYIFGHSTNQIARQLNRDGVPILGDKPKADHVYLEWSSNKIGAILRDRSVLGLVQPHHMVNGKRIAIGAERKVYDAAIDASDWLMVQEMLNARGCALRGRKGTLANLFTSRIFCGDCGGSMRVDTGAGGPGRHRVRKFQCTRYVGGRTCQHDTRYPVPEWEAVIVDQIIERSRLVPKNPGKDQSKAAEQLAAVQIEIQQLDEQIAFVEPKIAKSATIAERWESMCERRDALRAMMDTLALEAQAAQSSTTRHMEVHRFMQDVRGPALRGDQDARERLRGLLSKIDYKVVFGGEISGITMTVGDWSDSFPTEEAA
jgi:DNA invertase Pin-like site-specific DNA recombinase